MKRKIAEDGTRTHELTVPQKRAIRKAMEVLEEVAYFHRETFEGEAVNSVLTQLEFIHNGEKLVSGEDAPEDES